MTAVGMPPRRTVRIAVQSSAAISIATEEQQIAFASAELAEQSLSIGDGGPRAVALQRHPQFGMAFRGKELFTAVGGRQGKQGVSGEPGPAGGSTLQRIAGQIISALRAVYELDGVVRYLDYRDAEHVDLLVGVTITSGLAGEPVNIQLVGPLTDATWQWVPGPVWLGSQGQLTQAPPDDGFDVLIGSAVSATRIQLNLQRPIELE